ncbi:MAG: InlB B-repeat-containing protein, partial [Clostridia bacterium]|nr:InlB B-repeat-containing protein [Clostridia bacterium]
GWNWTTNNSYVTAEVNSRSQYYSITGTVATTKPQTIEFWNGAIKARVNVIVRAANYKTAAGDWYYDFTKVLPERLTVNHVHNIIKHIKYNHTSVGGYGEINAWNGTASEGSVYSTPWKYSNVASTTTFSPLFHNYGIQHKKKGIADIKIKIPADGLYLPQVALYQALGTPVTMSVINSAGTTVGSKTLAAGTNGTRVNFASEAIALKAGEYTVRFNKTETGSDVESGANYYNGLYFAYKGPIGTKLNMNANRNVTMAVGGNSTVKLNLSMSDGSAVDYTNGKITVAVDNTAIATATTTLNGASSSVKFTSKSAGTTSATITFTNGVFTSSQTVIINSSASTKLYMSATKTAIKPTDTAGSQITVKTADGAIIDNSNITFSSANTKVATVSSTGLIKPVAEGTTNINAVTTYGGTTYNLYIAVKVTTGKTSSSWYTEGRRTGSKTAVNNANTYLSKLSLDDIWNLVPTQELPRGAAVGHRYDPEMFICRYCGLDYATSQWGSYAYVIKPLDAPWQLQCPSCTRIFPSNDFGSFYKLGIGKDGMWDYELAKSENAKLVAAGQTGYLTNTRNPEKGAGWGVDDGYGYHSGKMIVNGMGETAEQVYTYIAYYNHWGLWYKRDTTDTDGIIQRLLETLDSAYFYSGDIKYGKAAAILVDRIADVYPTLYMEPYFPLFFNSDSTQPKGKMVGSIWQHTISRVAMKAYDAIYDVYEDPTVVEAISEKAAQYDLGSAKLTTVAIRERIEENLVLQTYKDIRNGNIHGNFGMHQSCAAYAGVIYDTMPKTKEILDWVYAASSSTYGDPDITGGNVNAQLVNLVDRDGHGAESAPNYNELWSRNLSLLAEAVEGYTTYEAGDLYQNLRFRLMLKAFLPIILVRNQVAQIGDSSAAGYKQYHIQDQFLRPAWTNTKDIEFAQFLYHKNKDKITNIPANIRQEILDVIAEHGEYDFDKSRQLSGYGFSIIRDGTYKENSDGSITDTQRDFWLYYGAANSHKHADVLNLGIEAYGVNVAPDIGYPTAADGSDKSVYWEQGTIMHNTVMTNDQSHNRIRSYTNGTPRNNGKPLHFDDSDRVKVMDVNAPPGSTNGTVNGIFRRSIVMVKVNDEVSYGVDFFRVKGGNEHLYNFHAMSDEIYATEGLTLVAQSGGSYAGADIAYETKGHVNGFTYLKNVRRATNCTTGNFAVDFKIKDFRNDWAEDMNLHLRLTMVNGFALSEVALATGVPPQRDGNPETLEFMMARRSGSNLDSLFTGVYEPYKDTRYIKSIASAKIERTGGAALGANDVAKAVQIVRTDGITDYVIYATNNQVTYKVAGMYDFQGVFGVISVKNGSVVYAYGNDAAKVHTTTSTAAYTGKVTDFTKTLSFENYVDVQFDTAVDANKLVGKHIDIENGRTENAVMEIVGATDLGSNKYRLDIGEKSLITILNANGTYVYNAAVGNTIRIPLPTVVSSTTVTLNVNGGTATGNKPTVTATYGANMPPVDDAIPTKTGYTFDGYYDTTDTSGTRYYNQNGKSCHVWDKSELAVTLYAAWKANTYKVQYNANGGSGSMSTSSHTYNTAKNLTANAFTRAGYTFAGWATSAGGAVAYADKASVKNLSSTAGDTINLYAVWTPITYSVKYNANGGSGSMSNSSHTYD